MTRPDVRPLLPDFLRRQRWFAGKDREFEIADVGWHDIDHLPGAELSVAVVDVRYADGNLETYQIPIGTRRLDAMPPDFLSGDEAAILGSSGTGAEQVVVYDALHDGELAGHLLTLFDEEHRSGTVRFSGSVATADAPPRLMSAEQSNTSVVYGDAYVLKVYRRVGAGVNPEVEVLRALTDVESAVIAPLLGTADAGERTLAVLQPFFATASEAWALALTSVRSVLAPGAGPVDEDGADFAGDAARLGAVTAELHADLARALPTRTASDDDHRSTAELLRARLTHALGVVAELEPYADSIHAAYDEAAQPSAGLLLQRIHGDYHLGQVLRVDTGWIVLDFEGEPARSLEERVALMSPLRDVAGMLRSFDYAARHLLADHPGSEQALVTADVWATRNRSAFLDGYAEASGTDPREHNTLLRAFELDKAVYEAMYEARYRPSWLPIPLAGIAKLLGQAEA